MVLLGMDRRMASILRVKQLSSVSKKHKVSIFFVFRFFLWSIGPSLRTRAHVHQKYSNIFHFQPFSSFSYVDNQHLSFSSRVFIFSPSICRFFFHFEGGWGYSTLLLYNTHTHAHTSTFGCGGESGEEAAEMLCAFFILVVFR